MKSKMGRSEVTTSNNTDFQSELLRMNGALQASITELRYHCEVYRLSLKSICKVLACVQKEQDARLRYLTTSRPSFQSYLLNLSQKQALDRIKNVVRKASTFINGYSLVDKQQFQPPPPKLLRRSGAENKTAPTTSSITKLTDGSRTGWVSKCYSGGISAAAVILPAIAEEGEEASANKEHGGGGADGSAEAASSKNNNGKVERKHFSSSRRKRGGEGNKKSSENNSKSKKSKSRTSSRSSHRHSTSGSVSGDAKRRRINSVGGNDDKRSSTSSSREIKKSQSDKEKMRSKTSRKNNVYATDSVLKLKGEERKKLEKQTRSKSITATRNNNHHHDNRHHHHYHDRYQLINSRTLSSQRGVDDDNDEDETVLEDENDETGEIFCVPDELKRGHSCKLQSSLMNQFGGGVANRIPPLLSIATSSSSTGKVNKTFSTSHVNEKLKTEVRRVRRPSKEKQLEGRRRISSRNNSRSASQNNERETKTATTISRSRASQRSICSIRWNEIHAKRTSTNSSSMSTRRWGNTSTITAGYKVRESLAVLRNRNSGNGSITHQGQGVVAARKYLFSSHKPRSNNFKLNSSTVSTTATTTVEKVRRVQLNGNSGEYNSIGTFCGVNVNKDRLYGASRKKTTTSTSNNNGSGNNSFVRNCINNASS